MFATMRDLFEGRFEEAEAMVNETFRIGLPAHPSALRFMGAQLALLRRDQGRAEEFRVIVHGGGFDQASDILIWSAACWLADLEAGDEAGARAGFRELAEHEFADVLDEPADAAVLYERVLPLRGQFVVLAIGVLCMGSASHYLGLLALTRRDYDEAEQLLAEAIDDHERVGAVPMLTRSRLAYLRVLRGRDAPGDRERAGPLREVVIADADRLGMAAVLAEARALG
jgi:hypothetical protein